MPLTQADVDEMQKSDRWFARKWRSKDRQVIELLMNSYKKELL